MAHEVSRRPLIAEICVQFVVDKAVIRQFSANVSVFPSQCDFASTSVTDDSKLNRLLHLKPQWLLHVPLG